MNPEESDGDGLSRTLAHRSVDLSGGCVDLVRHAYFRRDGREVPLSPQEAALLGLLASRAGTDLSRDAIQEALGHPSDGMSRAVDVAIRRLRAKVERDPGRPEHIITVHGAGYRFVAASSRQPRTNMHQEATPFVGRGQTLEQLAGTLRTGGTWLTLTGAPGIGKSRTARELGMRSDLGGGAWFVSFAGCRDASELAPRVAEVLDLTPSSAGDGAAGVARALVGHGDVLVILDNLEGMVEGGARRVLDSWCRAAPRARWLVTSQRPLDGHHEQVVALEPLDDEAAMTLLRGAIERVSPRGVTLDEGVLGDVARMLDRVPLALELAAARTGVLGLAQLRERLSDRFALLRRRDRAGPLHHATLRTALEHAWELLTPELQTALNQLTVFRGGFDLDGADAVLAVPDLSGREAVGALRERSLVHERDGRLLLLSSIGQFASERGIDPSVRDRHAAAIGAWVEHPSAPLESVHSVPRAVVRELDNFLAATAWTRGRDPEQFGRVCYGAALAYLGRASLPEALRVLTEGLEVPGTSTAWRIRLRGGRGTVSRLLGNLENARGDLETALGLCEGPGATLLEGTLRANLGGVLGDLGETAAALVQLEQAQALLEASGRMRLIPHVLVTRSVHVRGSDPGRARALLEDAVQRHRTLGAPLGAAVARANLAMLDAEAGLYARAREAFAQVQEVYRAHDARLELAISQANLGELALVEGDLDLAAQELSKALTTLWSLGALRLVSAVQATLALVWIARGQREHAVDAAVEACARLGMLEATEGVKACLARGILRFADLGFEGAREDLDRAAARLTTFRDPRLAASVLWWKEAVSRRRLDAPSAPTDGYEAALVRAVSRWTPDLSPAHMTEDNGTPGWADLPV